MKELEKPWYKSKKFLALALLVVMTTVLILAGILLQVDPNVLQAMVTILGGTTGAAGAGLIGAQGYVDSKVRPAVLNTEVVEKEEIVEQ
ncbi:MAG TPA: hypothetical protein DCW74_17195 [Alteromonas australica]|uniref:Uncharacterized protein n=1 Tax=Alteromonas australica TaxID=589873 RepID=A0A350P840_9ALTE|nr:hypothetical protein [Alteromonas australica]|tara:strand:- start:529 stop:795 length:267 start_codon:yes stop_codon:yes gene_type:complete